MHRRHFIGSGLGIGMLCIAGTGSAAGQVSAAGFAALLKDSFNVYDRVRGISVQLVKVRQAAAAPGTRQFSLTFAGSMADALPSGTYEVEHAATGKQLMFLDASGRGQHGVLYRADFNLLA
jgi:hypothetical protein